MEDEQPGESHHAASSWPPTTSLTLFVDRRRFCVGLSPLVLSFCFPFSLCLVSFLCSFHSTRHSSNNNRNKQQLQHSTAQRSDTHANTVPDATAATATDHSQPPPVRIELAR
jgi:hypothetical protein